MIKITLDGEPLPCARPRLTTVGGYARAYDKQHAEKEALKWKAKAEWSRNGGNLAFKGAVDLELRFYLSLPTSLSKKTRSAHLWGFSGYEHLTKPDIDNLSKTVLDVLNGIAWYDDRQVVSIKSSKCYDSNPRTEVTIMPMKECDLSPECQEILGIFGPDQVEHLIKCLTSLSCQSVIAESSDDPDLKEEALERISEIISLLADTHSKSLTKVAKSCPGWHIGSRDE